MENNMNPTQKAARELLRCDFRYVYTTLNTERIIPGSYMVAMIPYLGMVMDGAENWVAAMNQVSPGTLDMPTFTSEEKSFYQEARGSIKLWDKTYAEIFGLLQNLYLESDHFFSSKCKPIAKQLHLYDIFGAYLINGHFSGNTILWALTLPGYHLDNSNYGPTLKGLSIVSGKYVACFDALKPFTVIDSAAAKNRDFGGFVKSPVGNTFSYKFVLFSLLCQLNFLIYGVNNLLVENPPTKLRFSYIMYYYLCNVLPEVNATHDTNFELNRRYQSREFRNAMAHYKLGAYLKPSELIFDDPMFGMTQKGFGLDYCAFEEIIMSELLSLSVQIEKYLKL